MGDIQELITGEDLAHSFLEVEVGDAHDIAVHISVVYGEVVAEGDLIVLEVLFDHFEYVFVRVFILVLKIYAR